MEWERTKETPAPGKCPCGTFQDWHVLKKPLLTRANGGHARALNNKTGKWEDIDINKRLPLSRTQQIRNAIRGV
jgi:hypothetical protein